MTLLVIASIVHWGRYGNDQLKRNWAQGLAEHAGGSAASILKQVYFGVCLGMLGLTGFECTSLAHGGILLSDQQLYRHTVLHLSNQGWQISCSLPESPHPCYPLQHLANDASHCHDSLRRGAKRGKRSQCVGSNGECRLNSQDFIDSERSHGHRLPADGSGSGSSLTPSSSFAVASSPAY